VQIFLTLRILHIGGSVRCLTVFVAGEKLADIYEGQRSFDLVLRLNRNYTESIDGIRAALIDTGVGRKVPLEEVADIVSVGGPASISRENVQLTIMVSANVSGRDLRSVINDIQRTIARDVQLPEVIHDTSVANTARNR